MPYQNKHTFPFSNHPILSHIFNYVFSGLLAAFLLVSCGENATENRSDSTEDPSTQKITTVKVVHPTMSSFTGQISMVGTALPNKKVMVHAMESGVVAEMKVDIGASISKGETIAKLENPELIRLREKAVAQKEVSESAYNRLKDIRTKSPALTTLQQVETAEADYKMALAQLHAVEDRMNFLNVTAPFSGVISQRFVDEGALVQNGVKDNNTAPLVELQDLSVIRISVPVPEVDVTNIHVGQSAKVSFRELGGKEFQAKVSRTSMALDPASKTMEVQIDIANSDRIIRPGMYAHVAFNVKSSDNVISLPQTAVTVKKGKFSVYVVKDGVVKIVAITQGLYSRDRFEVTSELSADALVIIEGKSMVKPGQKVQTVLAE